MNETHRQENREPLNASCNTNCGRKLGMYVHMHWGYNHPYAARTWTLEDWRGYAGGLAALGFNLIMIWPMLEIIPDPLTKSDIAHLEKMRQVIDLLHSDFGMDVIITLGANVIGNEHAREFPFEIRPYFKCDQRLNPGNKHDVDRLIQFRRNLYAYLAKADGIAIIDSDPGGYIGSTNDEFSNLLWRHIDMVHEYNPSAQLYYWMWMGWEAYNKMWKEVQEGKLARFDITSTDFKSVIRKLMERPNELWRILSCQPIHQEIVDEFGIQDRAMFFPYGLVEKEPTFPRTNCDPDDIYKEFAAFDFNGTGLGQMANSQTHAVQQPNTYIFAHFAKGGTRDSVDLPKFADGLIPGSGKLIAQAWEALNESDPVHIREISSLVRKEIELATNSTGPFSGLLLRTPKQFLDDLALQLDWHADMREFSAAIDHNNDWHKPLNALISSWNQWYLRTGFTETHCSLGIEFIHSALRKLHTPELDAVLDDLEDWRDPSKRHGLVTRLLTEMLAIAKETSAL